MVETMALAALLALLSFKTLPTSTARPDVDALFKAYARTDSPGCALLVEQNGKLLYEQAYGMANLELGVPIGPQTVFHVASLSKQVTAFAVQLLAESGKLSLDDDVRKYVPELHDFGHAIRLSNLLHHTSGLRDQWDLVSLGGWRMEDVITEDDLLGLLFRQRELNFEPGSKFLYCNSGYTLLALVVSRVSGQTFPDFCAEHIFKPLGMTHTSFHLDATTLVTNRAESYDQDDSGVFQRALLNYSNVGATSLMTTTDDFAKWTQNLFTGAVGGAQVVKRMTETVPLTSGSPNLYASGLIHGTYRGVPVMEHTGADAGFRTDSLLFPQEKLAVICFSNCAEADVAALSRKVAVLFVKQKLRPERKPAAPVPVPLSWLARYAGTYEFDPGAVMTVAVRDGSLQVAGLGGAMRPMTAAGEDRFDVTGLGRWRFREGSDGSFSVTVTNGDQKSMGRRLTLQPFHPADYVGDYYSDELDQVFHVKQSGDGLQVTWLKNSWDLEPLGEETFGSAWRIFRFQRSKGKPFAFTISTGRSYNVRFRRIELQSASGPK